MTSGSSTAPVRFDEVIRQVDAANAEDPNREVLEGEELPKEVAYSRRMTRWLERLEPDASEALRIAVRAQHIRRWTVPRSSYPMDRQGYRQWRTDLGRFHAETAGKIVRDAGYPEETASRVESLLRKERLKLDQEAQTLEDVACLVFLEAYFADFARQYDEEKIVTILRRTWAKMSDRGRDAALTIPLPGETKELVARALAPNPPE